MPRLQCRGCRKIQAQSGARVSRVLTEYGQILAEIERKAAAVKPKLPALERAAWRWRPRRAQPVDHFTWHEFGSALPDIEAGE